MGNKFDTRQTISYAALAGSIGSAANAGLNTILGNIDATMVTLAGSQTLTNKVLAFLRQNVVNDSTTTGSAATLQAGDIVAGVTRLTNASLISVSGIPAGVSGQSLVVENQTGNSITLNNDDAGAASGARIYTGSNGAVSMAANSTFLFTYDSTSAHWMLTGGSGSGSGSGGSKNYLTTYTASLSSGVPNTGNGDFSLGSTTGFSLGTVGTLTNGIPTGTPTFGSGASGNLAISVVSSGQLAGAYSLSYASSAATTQGNMLASNSFFIDKEDQAKVLGWKFYYSANTNPTNGNFSGTSSNSFAVAAWDVTNSVWLSLAGNFAMTQSAGVGIASGTLQTNATTAQIRFVVYNANASAGAITMYFDDFFVGPQTVSTGSVITDWQSYTPTVTGAASNPVLGSGAIQNGFYRRVGGNLEVIMQIQAGTSGNTAGSGVYFFGLPPGLTPDTTKIVGLASANLSVNLGSASNAATVLGRATVGTPTGAGSVGDGQVMFNTTASPLSVFVTFHGQNANTDLVLNRSFQYGSGGSNAQDFSVATSGTYLTCTVPIAGWSSNVQMSNDTDTRVIAFAANTSSTSITSTATTVVYSSVERDEAAAYNSTTGIYTVPVTGWYSISATLRLNATYALNQASTMYIRQNSTDVRLQNVIAGGANTSLYPFVGGLLYCKAGDSLSIRCDSGGASPTIASGSNYNYVQIEKVSGPATIAATESVSARYTTTAGQSIANGSTVIVNFDTKDAVPGGDSHGSVTTGASWQFKAPTSGRYSVKAMCFFTTAPFTSNNDTSLFLYKNGSFYSILDNRRIDASLTSGRTLMGVDEIYLLAGEFVDVRVAHGETTARSLITNAGYNRVSIVRVGN